MNIRTRIFEHMVSDRTILHDNTNYLEIGDSVAYPVTLDGKTYVIQSDVVPSAVVKLASNAWRCICGMLNDGTHGEHGVNDGKPYSVCAGCSTETFKWNVIAEYFLMTTSTPHDMEP